MTSIFDFLKLEADEGIFGFLADVWNAAVDLVAGVITGLIELITLPIVTLITDALMIIGTLSLVANLLTPWDVTVLADAPGLHFAVEGAPDNHGGFTAVVETDLKFSWPASLVDCAQVAGFTLPNPTEAVGSETFWSAGGLPPLGSVQSWTTELDEDNTSRLEFITGREESHTSNQKKGTATGKVVIVSKGIEELRILLGTLIADAVPVEPIGDLVATVFEPLTAPIFDKLAKLVQISGAASTVITYHVPEVTTTTGASTSMPTSTAPPTSSGPGGGGPSIDQCLLGTWVSDSYQIPTAVPPPIEGGAGVVVDIRADGNVFWAFDGSAPLEEIFQSDTDFSITTSHVAEGTAQGTYSAFDGAWTVNIDVSGMTSKMEVAGGSTVVTSPHHQASVMMRAGSYSCGDDEVVYTTPGGFGPVTVVLSKS